MYIKVTVEKNTSDNYTARFFLEDSWSDYHLYYHLFSKQLIAKQVLLIKNRGETEKIGDGLFRTKIYGLLDFKILMNKLEE